MIETLSHMEIKLELVYMVKKGNFRDFASAGFTGDANDRETLPQVEISTMPKPLNDEQPKRSGKPKPTPSQARIGRAIRHRRVEVGLSLAALAKQLGVALSTLSKLENGLVAITFERLEAISRFLQCEMADLISDEGGTSETNRAAPADIDVKSPFGNRRSITRAGEGKVMDSGLYTLTFLSTEILNRACQPAIAEVSLDNIAEYGPFTRHAGEEFNFVISGTLEFHSEVYAPVRLEKGDSIYFDAEMGHAHIKAGDQPCHVLAVFIPRSHQPPPVDDARFEH
ncbi:hypothetical protein C1T17_04325 [Sphingobium sp. SCG-1]|uniref:helix-turn-helix domain-containing protein n=1 Tax=Sphingobium sp. SCG-1 TaxID=2072936 RepID=UPI000CD6C30B|nr:XRE family transcriptional regulator [Sphingobium sp. SCG-1]AUW57443.1 hypothetical protein C1T17_04325 [Sphingobium sp. SCG-1]